MRRFSHIIIILLLTALLGCTSQNNQTMTALSTISTTPVNTSTPTIAITPTITTSSTPEQITIQFPEWVKNPETQILLAPTGIRNTVYEGMALFNAETSERFDIPFTSNIGDYFWMPDGSQFGFLPVNQSEITLFSIKEDIATKVLIRDSALRFFQRSYKDSPADPIQVSSSNITDSNFLLLPSWQPLSPDKKYFIYQEEYDETYTSVFDIASNQTRYVSDSKDGYFDLNAEWSPNSQFLAVSQADKAPSILNSFEINPTFRLRIYDIGTQQLVASYKNVTFPKWSPDGTKFLFQEWKKLDNWNWFGESPPCVFDTISRITQCYNQTITHHNKSNTIQTTFSSVKWSPDQTMIGYIYFNVETNPYKEHGGFCLIIVSSGGLKCMLSDFGIEDQKIIKYTWSPDSNYISFQYDTFCPYCDEIDNPQLGIANVKTGEYFPIGDNINFIYMGLWRPSVTR